jgi:hypothetical protein
LLPYKTEVPQEETANLGPDQSIEINKKAAPKGGFTTSSEIEIA